MPSPLQRKRQAISSLVQRPSQERVIQLLRDSGALLEGHFQLASGRHSAAYVEKFRLLQHPQHAEELCRLIADAFAPLRPQLVAGPTTGGIIISYEVARLLGVRSIFAERDNGGRQFQRGFHISPGEQTLVVDDVLTTGGSVGQVIDAVRTEGGEVVGLGVLIDRRSQKMAAAENPFGLPFFASLSLDLPSYDPPDCPVCKQGAPLQIT